MYEQKEVPTRGKKEKTKTQYRVIDEARGGKGPWKDTRMYAADAYNKQLKAARKARPKVEPVPEVVEAPEPKPKRKRRKTVRRKQG